MLHAAEAVHHDRDSNTTARSEDHNDAQSTTQKGSQESTREPSISHQILCFTLVVQEASIRGTSPDLERLQKSCVVRDRLLYCTFSILIR